MFPGFPGSFTLSRISLRDPRIGDSPGLALEPPGEGRGYFIIENSLLRASRFHKEDARPVHTFFGCSIDPDWRGTVAVWPLESSVKKEGTASPGPERGDL